MSIDFMEEAIKEAQKSILLDEVPVGAIIVKDEKIIGRGHNLRETLNYSIAHAEILAINDASQKLNSWRLSECDMYVTLEPCPMCAGAIVQARIRKLFIGSFDPKSGACGSVMNITQNDNLNHIVNVKWLYNERCGIIIEDFFKSKR